MFSATMADARGTAWAVAVFAAALLIPGYCVGWFALPKKFRARWDERLCWAVAVSFSIMPIGAVLLAGASSMRVVCLLLEVLGVAGVGFIAFEYWKSEVRWSRAATMLTAGILLWAAFVVGELVDVGVGDSLYMSVTVFDHALRTAFVEAVMRTGVPPHNPLFCADATGPGHCAPMHYYYFWYVLCAAVARIGGVSARQALMASCVWGGIGLLATLRLFCLRFATGLRRWTVAVALLAVTGLDIVPVVVNALAGGATDPDMEWWGVDQMSSWLDTLLWVPHHVAALVCCLTAFLLAWTLGRGCRGEQVCAALIGGAAVASAFGLSVYVAVGAGMTLVLWSAWVLGWEHGLRLPLRTLALACLFGVVLLSPFLRELRRSGETGGLSSGVPLRVEVRRMIDPASLAELAPLRRLQRLSPATETNVAAAFLLVPGYCAELGFFAGALAWAVWRIRRGRESEAVRSSAVLSMAGLLIVSVVRSNAIATNDFGIRASLVPQFFLLLLGARWWEEVRGRSGWKRAGVAVLILMGVLGTVYQALELRTYLPVQDLRGVAGFAGLAQRNGALRRASDQRTAALAGDAVLQFNNRQPSEWFRYAELLEAGQQMANANPHCETAFGGDRRFCASMQQAEEAVFDPAAPMDVDRARAACLRLGATVLEANRWDAVWDQADDWVWTLPVISATPDVRRLGCSTLVPFPARD